MMEKMGKAALEQAALEQAASMMVAVSHSSLNEVLITYNFIKYYEVADLFLFVLFTGCHGGGLSPLGLFVTA